MRENERVVVTNYNFSYYSNQVLTKLNQELMKL